ncbi:MAG: radical SAM protein [Bacteroidales bacterium]|nr:radical SAM protein [Bacteroidales bacterium]
MKDTSKHPCFNIEAKGNYGRVHLPVAPKCNIQCNYCNRQYDCVNESRPGVTSALLNPKQAVAYLGELRKKMPNLSVVGIAGPGDPFANAEETMDTLRLANEKFPDMLFCLSTNGVNLKPYIDDLAELGVSHVTITMNGLDPDMLGKVYAWVRADKKVYRGREAGEIILQKQLECIPLLKAKGITVKINTIILPGINEDHIETLAEKVAGMGADLMNAIPLYPTKDTAFETVEKPSKKLILTTKSKVAKHIKPMTHCARCRADAAGLLGKDIEGTAGMLREYAGKEMESYENRPYVAVATHEGILVNQHLGEAGELYIFEESKKGYKLVETRKTPDRGAGDFRWMELAGVLKDCRAILVGGAGPSPVKILEKSGLRIIQMTGLIDSGLDTVYHGKALRTVKKADAFKCGQACSGNAQGCA